MKSIIQTTKECYLCRELFNQHNEHWLEEHHVMSGTANRKLSERYGLKVWLCHYHHNEPPNGVHFNRENELLLKQRAQEKFEETYKEESFREIFGRNYL